MCDAHSLEPLSHKNDVAVNAAMETNLEIIALGERPAMKSRMSQDSVHVEKCRTDRSVRTERRLAVAWARGGECLRSMVCPFGGMTCSGSRQRWRLHPIVNTLSAAELLALMLCEFSFDENGEWG